MKKFLFGILLVTSVSSAQATDCAMCIMFTATANLNLMGIKASSELDILKAYGGDPNAIGRIGDNIMEREKEVKKRYKDAVAAAGNNESLKSLLRDYMAKWSTTATALLMNASENESVRDRRFDMLRVQLSEISEKIRLESE